MPASLWLDQFGAYVWDAFGEVCYLVGSTLRSELMDGREAKRRGVFDVDVRVILDDARYEAEGYGDPKRTHQNAKWVAMCLAFSELGCRMTGLQIDFQIQQRTEANKDPGPRSALGIVASHIVSAPRRRRSKAR
jgi:hypothetical protein